MLRFASRSRWRRQRCGTPVRLGAEVLRIESTKRFDTPWRSHQIEGSRGYEFIFNILGTEYTDAYNIDIAKVAPGGYSPLHIDQDNHAISRGNRFRPMRNNDARHMELLDGVIDQLFPLHI